MNKELRLPYQILPLPKNSNTRVSKVSKAYNCKSHTRMVVGSSMIIGAVAAIATMAFLGTLATFATPALIEIGVGALSCCCLGGYFINRGCSLKQ